MSQIQGILQRRVVIVTGAGQGIGGGCARVCAREGAAVAVCDIRGDNARAQAERIIASGGRAVAIEADCTDPEATRRMVTETTAQLGPPDGLICAAMTRTYQPAEDFTLKDWRKVLDQGLTGYFLSAQEAAQPMLARGHGSMVFIASTAAHTAVRGAAAYVAAKSGIVGLARQLGVEWASRGVRVNAVSPGFTTTEGAIRSVDPEEAARTIPVGHVATPEDIAEVCAFFLSDRARHVTAQELVVDGGSVVGRGFNAGRENTRG